MLSKLYKVIGGGLLLVYVAAAWQGWELGSPHRQIVPPDQRTREGYRSFHYLHSGYRGGK